MVSADVKTDLIQSTSDNVPSTQAEFPSKSVEPDAEPNPVQVDQETFNLMLVQLVVICALPFAILDSKFFRNFISILAPHLSVPPRQYFTKSVLEDVEKDIRQQVIKRINKQKFVSVVTDGWTDPNGAKIVNFMVVAPEMPSLFWKSCATGADEQSGEKIAQLIKSVIDDIHSVTTARVVGIVTDNASNMLDSWRNLKYSLSKLAIVGGGCAAHVLNLLMKDLFHHKALKKVSSSAVALTRFVRDHLALLDTFRSILESSRASGHKRSGLTLPVPTRWYSVFNCLENVFNNRDVFEEIFTGPHHSELLKRYRRSKASREKLDFMISLVEDPEFWEQLRITIRLIRPIQKALGELESDTQYASSVYKWFRYLRNHEYYRARTNATAPAADTVASSENAVEESDEPPDIPIVANYKPFTAVGPGVLEKLFRDKIQERWRYVHTSAMGIAFFLDPRASHDDFKPGDERKTREAAIRFALEAQLVSNDEIPKLTSELFEYARVKSGETGLAQTSPKTYWESVRREFPILGRVADVVFAIPPSSAASERAWSIFNHVHTKKRNRLGVDKVELLIFIYINYGALKGDIDLARHQSHPESVESIEDQPFSSTS